MNAQGRLKLMTDWPHSIEQLQIIARQHAEHEPEGRNPYVPKTAEWCLYIHYFTKRKREIAHNHRRANQWLVNRLTPISTTESTPSPSSS